MRNRYLCLLLLAACATHDDAPEAQAADLGNTEQVITLGIGESRTLAGGATVGVVAIPTDSRCPTGVQCVWAGSAAVAISIRMSQADTVATVNSGIEPRSFSFGNWHVVLRGVSPGPTAGQGVPRDQYRVTLGVGRD